MLRLRGGKRLSPAFKVSRFAGAASLLQDSGRRGQDHGHERMARAQARFDDFASLRQIHGGKFPLLQTQVDASEIPMRGDQVRVRRTKKGPDQGDRS